MMSYSIVAFLLSVIAILEVTSKVYATNVDHVVANCEKKEKRFADKFEDKYTLKGFEIPSLFPPPFIEEQQIKAYELERIQRNFECIADVLKRYSDQDLESSDEYQNLVKKCHSVQPTTPHCDPSYPYRQINGTCNNLIHPRWGSTFAGFRRLWPANYEGVSGFRKSVQEKKPLPNTRDISRELVKPAKKLTKRFNSLFAFFGQLIAHDLAQFPFTLVNGTERLDCCSSSTKSNQHPQCAPIFIKPTDGFYFAHNVSCFNFVRVIPSSTCSVEKRIQMNYVTAYIDCSVVHGQTNVRAQKLRRNDGTGKLKAQYRESGELMPPRPEFGPACGDISKQQYCFENGDTRTNQQTPLMIFQTLLFREHNRIADQLKTLNPHWQEEKLYQESRKILIAEFQVIIYNEYLPILLGPKLMSDYRLKIGNGRGYDSSVDPSISIEFNAASFRVHSLLPGKAVFHEEYEYLRGLFANSIPIYNDRMSSYLMKMANYTAEKYDRFMPVDVTLYLYKERKGTYGFDLAAVDIQRGRDAGLPTYPQVIEYIEDRPGTIETFDDLRSYIVPRCLIKLQKLYLDVRDIDFFVGINCEIVPDDMIISPTAAEIIAEQFETSKIGDRFNVEHDRTLTDEQRKTLSNASLAKLICDNTKVVKLQPKAMLFESDSNVPRPCSEIPGVDLDKWIE